jgi:hypothetical protein
VEFREGQKMTQWWIWLILFCVAGIWIWAIIQQLLLGQLFGERPMNNMGLILTSFIPLGLIVLFYILSLKTRVSAQGIDVRYYPLWSTHIPWHQIQSAEIVRYPFVGYGIRYSSQYGTVYNARGQWGLLILKKNGEKLLVGTQKPDELLAAVKKHQTADISTIPKR